MKFGMINVKYQIDHYFNLQIFKVQVRDAAESSQPSLDREDSSLELTASRKEGTKGRVSDVSKKNFNLDNNF